jgi:hypothetical protein
MLKGKLVSIFRQPRRKLNRQIDSPTERDTYSFLGDDDEMRLLLMAMIR